MFLELMIVSKLVADKGNVGMNEVNRFGCNLVFLVWELFVGAKSGHDKGVQY